MKKIVLLVIFCFCFVIGCSSSKSIVGKWYLCQSENNCKDIVFKSDGVCTGSLIEEEGYLKPDCSYTLNGDSITLKMYGQEGDPLTYIVEDNILKVGDLTFYSDIEDAKLHYVDYAPEEKFDVGVENYVGKNYIEVKGMLLEYGINVVVEKKTNSNDELVVDQSIKEGSTLNAGDTITLYI